MHAGITCICYTYVFWYTCSCCQHTTQSFLLFQWNKKNIYQRSSFPSVPLERTQRTRVLNKHASRQQRSVRSKDQAMSNKNPLWSTLTFQGLLWAGGPLNFQTISCIVWLSYCCKASSWCEHNQKPHPLKAFCMTPLLSTAACFLLFNRKQKDSDLTPKQI